MGKWILGISIVLLGSAMVISDAEARRLGGGRTIGAQRNVTAPPAQTPARPAQQQVAPAQQAGTQAAPAAAGNRWAPILGGLALGGMLGYLFGGNGLIGLLLLAALAIVAVLGWRALVRRREEAAPQPMQYAGMRETVAVPQPQSSIRTELPAAQTARIPAGFDVAGFLRAAKLNFIKLQVANDAGQLEELREFTTSELFDELRKDVAERGGAQQTDVVALDAELLEVVTEADKHWASVRFSGTVREAPGTAAAGFEEVWNLVKPADGSSGWLLAGIQQMH